jgi:hypothetical protein
MFYGERLSRTIVLLAGIAALSGCSTWNWTLGGHPPPLPAATDAIERSSIKLANAPNPAGECIVANARTAGLAAELVPLYGLESVAVIVTASVAGEHVAVFSLTRGDGTTRAQETTWAGVPNREELLRKLTQGC